MRTSRTIKAINEVECREIKAQYPNAELVGWASNMIPEQWFWIYKIEEGENDHARN
jgi:hypothetical protein